MTAYSAHVPFVGAPVIAQDRDFMQGAMRHSSANRNDWKPVPGLSGDSAIGFIRDVMGYLNALEVDHTGVRIRYFVDGEGIPLIPDMFRAGMCRPVGNLNPKVLESQSADENPAHRTYGLATRLLNALDKSLQRVGLEIVDIQATIQSITNNTTISDSNMKANNVNVGAGNVIRQGLSTLSKGAQSSQ